METKEDNEKVRSEIDIREDKVEQIKNLQSHFTLSKEDEDIFNKLLKIRATISNAFKTKFKIDTMKTILKNSEVVRFSSPHDENVDKDLPIFRFTMKIPQSYIDDADLSDKALEYIKLKKSPNENDTNEKPVFEELCELRTQILSREVFDKYLDSLIASFNEYFEKTDNKEYKELSKDIFEILPEKQAKEFICNGIFKIRFFSEKLFSGQFEFLF